MIAKATAAFFLFHICTIQPNFANGFGTLPSLTKWRLDHGQYTRWRPHSQRPSSFQDDFIRKQKIVNEETGAQKEPSKPILHTNAITATSMDYHLEHQRRVFDDMSDFFNSDDATPSEVKPILHFLVKTALTEMITHRDHGVKSTNDIENGNGIQRRKYKVMDVGCGTGALFPYYLHAADELNIDLDLTAIDLSSKMIQCATENSQRILKDNPRHSIQCIHGDFVQTIIGREMAINYNVLDGVGVGEGVGTSNHDAVIINACFANFINADSVVTACASCLGQDGVMVISHPLGSDFVNKLNEKSPETVPGKLPTQTNLYDLLLYQPMECLNFFQEAAVAGGSNDDSMTMYYASAKKTSHQLLKNVVRLRGPVDEGYGRGGKKLGFPTANLPASYFAHALVDVPTGVYMGWAVIEGRRDDDDGAIDDEKKGRNIIHKAVVNVGYSPTFDGEENQEKIVEAHLIVDQDAIEGDFYGETMRLGLYGFLRPEMKFPSFPDLIKAITNDVDNAKRCLDDHPFSYFGEVDPFMNADDDKGLWVGGSGGNDSASHEFESSVDFLNNHNI